MIESAAQNAAKLNGRAHSTAVARHNGAAPEATLPLRNDALSYWKLPADCSEAVEELNRGTAEAAELYLLERYLPERQRRPPKSLKLYYPFKQFLPRYLRHHFNAMFIRARVPNEFPAWPCESALSDYWRHWLHRASAELDPRFRQRLAFWPEGRPCCVVLTHDVETRMGFDRIERMADLEEALGFRSCWNLPLGQYEIDWRLVERLRARGFEFGAHGLCHDGKLFRSPADFAQLAPAIEQRAAEHGLRGFRSPSTLRSLDWIATMNFDFDSSVADTDPFEPQAGGCCSLFPFFLGSLVELPYTLPQDHTMIHLLNRNPLATWVSKAAWIAGLGGMILMLTHPDYIGESRYFEVYREMLKHLQTIEHAWRALPSEVASWWRRRARANLECAGDQPRVEGADTTGIVAIPLNG